MEWERKSWRSWVPVWISEVPESIWFLKVFSQISKLSYYVSNNRHRHSDITTKNILLFFAHHFLGYPTQRRKRKEMPPSWSGSQTCFGVAIYYRITSLLANNDGGCGSDSNGGDKNVSACNSSGSSSFAPGSARWCLDVLKFLQVLFASKVEVGFSGLVK